MSAMQMAWQTPAKHLECRWSVAGERVQYNPPWIQEASRSVPRRDIAPLVPDFTRLSPFGGPHWYVLDRLRRSSMAAGAL